MKSIALMALAYGQPGVLSSMADFLADERFNFYVHLDKKVKENDYKTTPAKKEIVFLEERYEVYWGGFEMIRATIALIKEALSNPDNEYFCLVSDDSFPLAGADEIYRAVVHRPFRISAWEGSLLAQKRYDGYYRFDSAHSSARFVPAESRLVTVDDIAAYERVAKLMKIGKRPAKIYSGSQWWCMPRSAVERILANALDDQWLMDSFEFSGVPDEQFFQTLAFEDNPSLQVGGNSPMYADFERNPKPFVFQSLADIDETKLNHRLFIRKIGDPVPFLDWASMRTL